MNSPAWCNRSALLIPEPRSRDHRPSNETSQFGATISRVGAVDDRGTHESSQMQHDHWISVGFLWHSNSSMLKNKWSARSPTRHADFSSENLRHGVQYFCWIQALKPNRGLKLPAVLNRGAPQPIPIARCDGTAWYRLGSHESASQFLRGRPIRSRLYQCSVYPQ